MLSSGTPNALASWRLAGLGLGGAELLGLHPDGVAADHGDHDVGAVRLGADGRAAGLLEVLGVRDAGHPELGAAPELEAEVEPAGEDADQRPGR